MVKKVNEKDRQALSSRWAHILAKPRTRIMEHCQVKDQGMRKSRLQQIPFHLAQRPLVEGPPLTN